MDVITFLGTYLSPCDTAWLRRKAFLLFLLKTNKAECKDPIVKTAFDKTDVRQAIMAFL